MYVPVKSPIFTCYHRTGLNNSRIDGARGKKTAYQCRRHKRLGFDPWVRKIPCKRAYWGGLQYSCLENPMDRGAWWATVHRVAESGTAEWLSAQPSRQNDPTLLICTELCVRSHCACPAQSHCSPWEEIKETILLFSPGATQDDRSWWRGLTDVVHWRREWQNTSIFLPWEPYEQYEKAKW